MTQTAKIEQNCSILLSTLRGYNWNICFQRKLPISLKEYMISVLHMTEVSSLCVNVTLSCFFTVCDWSIDNVS